MEDVGFTLNVHVNEGCTVKVAFVPLCQVTLQVRSLYGPLLACVTASKSAFEAMVRQHSPDGTIKTYVEMIRDDPKGREAEIYRRASCLQPDSSVGLISWPQCISVHALTCTYFLYFHSTPWKLQSVQTTLEFKASVAGC